MPSLASVAVVAAVALLRGSVTRAIPFDPSYLAALECGCVSACSALAPIELTCGSNYTWYYVENATNTVQPSKFIDWLGSKPSFTYSPLMLTSPYPINCTSPNTDFSLYNLSQPLYNQAKMVQHSPTQCLVPLAFHPPNGANGDFTFFLALSSILPPDTATTLTLSYVPPANMTLYDLHYLDASANISYDMQFLPLVDDRVSFFVDPVAVPFPPCCGLPNTLWVNTRAANGTVLCAYVQATRFMSSNLFQLPATLSPQCAVNFTTVPGVEITYLFDVKIVSPPPCVAGPNVTFLRHDQFYAHVTDPLTQSPTSPTTHAPTTQGPTFTGAVVLATVQNDTSVCPPNSARLTCAGGGRPVASVMGTAFWNSSYVFASIENMFMAYPYNVTVSAPSISFTQGPPNVTETSWALTGSTCNHIVSYSVQGQLAAMFDSETHVAEVRGAYMPLLNTATCDQGCVNAHNLYNETIVTTVVAPDTDHMDREAVYDILLPDMQDTDVRVEIDFVRVTFRVNETFHLTQIINPSFRAMIMNNTAYSVYPEYRDGHVCRYKCGLLINDLAGRWNSQVPANWYARYCPYDNVHNRERFAFTPANWIFNSLAGHTGSFEVKFYLLAKRCGGGAAPATSEIEDEAQIAGTQFGCVASNTVSTVVRLVPQDDTMMIVWISIGAVAGALAVAGLGVGISVLVKSSAAKAAAKTALLGHKVSGTTGSLGAYIRAAPSMTADHWHATFLDAQQRKDA